MSILVAATHPQRTSASTLYGTCTRRMWAPWAKDALLDLWGPSIANDAAARRAFARYQRLAASPGGRESGVLLERRTERAHRDGAMADAIFLLVGQFAEGCAQRRIEEDGIVAEATGATRLACDHAFDHAFCDVLFARWRDYRNHSPESRRSLRVRHCAQRLEQPGDPSRIVESRSAVPRRPPARRAGERIDFESRVVRERERARLLRRRARLQQRVV